MTVDADHNAASPADGLSFDALRRVGRRRLKDLHDAGTVPSLSDLDGRA